MIQIYRLDGRHITVRRDPPTPPIGGHRSTPPNDLTILHHDIQELMDVLAREFPREARVALEKVTDPR